MKKTKITPPPNWEDTPQSFDRFKALAKDLMAFSKKELDRKQTKPQRDQKKQKKKA